MNPNLKTTCFYLTASILVLLISAHPAAAQGTSTTTVAPQGQTSAASTPPKFRGIKGAPYSAEEISETTQTLADGNEITNKRVTKRFRDSEGRVREEMFSFRGGTDDAQNDSPAYITIYDPVAGVTYRLNPRDHTAVKVTRHPPPPPRAAQATGTAQQQTPPRPVKSPLRTDSKSESLGNMSIEGLDAHGVRNTYTFPAGMFGNVRPIVAVDELWVSTELHLPLLTQSDDPRTGRMTARLTNISLDEPPASLFEVPSDYTILEETPVRTSDANSPPESMQ